MRIWIGILLLLLLAAAAAFGWQWVVEDPGYVLVRLRGTSIETSLVFAAVALLLAWGLLSIAWRLLRWPARAWVRAQRRRARENLASGLAAFAEGRYLHAERCLAKATRQDAVRGPAFLAMARAAHARGDDDAASRALDNASADVAAAALAQRAKQASQGLAAASAGTAKIVLEAVQEMLLKLALQMAREDYELRRERQAQGIERAKGEGKYRGRRPRPDVHRRVIELRSSGMSIAKTAALAGCSVSHVKRVWAAHRETGHSRRE